MIPASVPGAPMSYVSSGIPAHDTEPPRPAWAVPRTSAQAASMQPAFELLAVPDTEWAEFHAQALQAFSHLRQDVEALTPDKRVLVSLRLRTLNERQGQIDSLNNTRQGSADDTRRFGISLIEQLREVEALNALLSDGWSSELATLLKRSERLAAAQLFLEQLSDPPPMDAIRYLPELSSMAYEAHSLTLLDQRLQSWSAVLNRIQDHLAVSGAWPPRRPTSESPGLPPPVSGVATAAALSATRRPHP